MITEPQTFQQLFQSLERLNISLVWGLVGAAVSVTGFLAHLYMKLNKTLIQTAETHSFTEKMATNELPHIQDATERTALAVQELVGVSKETLTTLNKVSSSMESSILAVAKLQGFIEGQVHMKDIAN